MNIIMFTNTFSPHVGGVAKSVAGLSDGLRVAGHNVLVVAPTFEGVTNIEKDVLRVPAIQHFRGSDFSVPFPVGHSIYQELKSFNPDIIHSHHPFLLGDTALRTSAMCNRPIVFTHHTRYEQYSHYAVSDSTYLKKLALELTLGYCDLCDAVIAPSDSIASFLRANRYEGLVEVIPSGIHINKFKNGSRASVRRKLAIPDNAYVIGHVGRLAPEKNLLFLAEAISHYLVENRNAYCLIAGEGPMKQAMLNTFDSFGVLRRLHFAGNLDEKELCDIYSAMDVFAFSSCSETQGLVIVEAMAAGLPIVAIDSPGVREVVRDGVNGRLLSLVEQHMFPAALKWIADLTPEQLNVIRQAARDTADCFSWSSTVKRVLLLYQSQLPSQIAMSKGHDNRWREAQRLLREDWKIAQMLASAVLGALSISAISEKRSEHKRSDIFTENKKWP